MKTANWNKLDFIDNHENKHVKMRNTAISFKTAVQTQRVIATQRVDGLLVPFRSTALTKHNLFVQIWKDEIEVSQVDLEKKLKGLILDVSAGFGLYITQSGVFEAYIKYPIQPKSCDRTYGFKRL